MALGPEASGAGAYKPAATQDRDLKDSEPPQPWQLFAKGAGQCEYQGFSEWTEEEQELWRQGLLKHKWGVGQVSIRLPVKDGTTFLALMYGYLPFVIPIWWAVWAGTTRITLGCPRFFPMFGLCIAVGFALVNEVIIKQVCKRVLPAQLTNRPPEAVCKHPGMPSGHVMNAYTLMVWCFLEAALDKMVHPEWLFVIALVLGPVPWARVYNKDHTVAQVVVSAVIASVMGCIAFYIRKAYYPNHQQPWEWYSAGRGIENPYSPHF
mmetsp:Transcript_63312/g.182086  ORF Transcript_63312/g.182086 Transcript_63312/m.182086 type:complete len:264 (-) Transcript_63312:224-1015(-)